MSPPSIFWNLTSLYFWIPLTHHRGCVLALSRKKQSLHRQDFEDTLFLFQNMGITPILSLKDQNLFEPNIKKMSQATIFGSQSPMDKWIWENDAHDMAKAIAHPQRYLYLVV